MLPEAAACAGVDGGLMGEAFQQLARGQGSQVIRGVLQVLFHDVYSNLTTDLLKNGRLTVVMSQAVTFCTECFRACHNVPND